MDIILVSAMFLSLIVLLMSGFPVAFTLGGTALIFGGIGYATGFLDFTYLSFLPNRLFENIIRNELLFAVPLFVAMGVMLEKSRVAEDLLDTMGQLFGKMRGGLGISVTIVGALLAASTGIVGATVVTMGLLSLPTMLKRGYDPVLATGSIAAAGTLGQIIPPSIVLILLADVLSNAWQQSQRAQGIFAPNPMSAGELFAGAIIPGLLLVGLYILYQVLIALFQPHRSPAFTSVSKEGARSTDTPVNRPEVPLFSMLLKALFPPLFLIIAVLGSILAGIATPTEAASVGAVGAILLAALRLSNGTSKTALLALLSLAGLVLLTASGGVRTEGAFNGFFYPALALTGLFATCFAGTLFKVWRAGVLSPTLFETVRLSSMIYAILIGAALFSLVFRGLGGDEVIESLLTGLPGGAVGALLFVMLLMFILGFFLDFIEITFVVVPLVAPVLLALDGVHGPVWLGILMAMNLQTSFLTPPFGFALFYLRGVAGDHVSTRDIYRGAWPFVGIQLIALLLIAFYPGLVTWLPSLLFP